MRSTQMVVNWKIEEGKTLEVTVIGEKDEGDTDMNLGENKWEEKH